MPIQPSVSESSGPRHELIGNPPELSSSAYVGDIRGTSHLQSDRLTGDARRASRGANLQSGGQPTSLAKNH